MLHAALQAEAVSRAPLRSDVVSVGGQEMGMFHPEGQRILISALYIAACLVKVLTRRTYKRKFSVAEVDDTEIG